MSFSDVKRSRSGWEVASEIKSALTDTWAATIADLEVADEWNLSELDSSLGDNDVRIGYHGAWVGTGPLYVAIAGTGDEYAFEAITNGGMRQWSFQIILFFQATADGETTCRMVEHYLQVAWVCLVDYDWSAADVIACIDETRRIGRVDLTPEIDLGPVVGGTLYITATVAHAV